MLDRILTKLGQNDQWMSGYKSYQQFDLKGHGGHRGQKGHFHEIGFNSPIICDRVT